MTTKASQTAILVAQQPQTGVADQYGLRTNKITVGRHPSNDIVLAFDSVSRFHGTIERRGEHYVYTDLGSSNGTTLNGVKITEVVLKHRDELRIGNIPFLFLRPSEHPEDIPENIFSDQLVSLSEETGERDSASRTAISISEFRKPASSAVLTPADEKRADREVLLRLTRRLGALYRLSEILRDIDQVEEQAMLRQVLDITLEGAPADRAVFLNAIDPEAVRFEVSLARYRADSIPSQKLVVSRSMLAQVAREKVAILSLDSMADDRTAIASFSSAPLSRSSIAAPIIIQKKIFGVIFLDSLRIDKTLSQDDLKFIGMVATETGNAIARLKLRNDAMHKNRLAAMGETIAGISHNVKNVLILSQGGGDVLTTALDRGDVQQAKEAWKIIQRGTEKIGTLMRDMLEYSSNRPVEYERIDVNDMIERIAEEIEEKLLEKRVALQLDLDESIEPRYVDHLGLQRAVMNLIINSLDAITRDDGRIIVKTSTAADKSLKIEIEDNGNGISSDKIKRIFEPFFTTKGSSGTGLGLPMCKKTIEDMGGTISCKSEEGGGTQFVMTIPYYQSPPTQV